MHEDERKLLKQLSQSDEDAFETLFRKHYPLLCACARRLLPTEEAEGCAQETMLWLWENREEVVIESSLAQYLVKMTWRRGLNKRARLQMKTRVEEKFCQWMQASLGNADYSQFDELRRHVSAAIAALPQPFREAFIMHRIDEMTYKQIADRLGVAPQTVAYRIQQALKLLRIALRDYLTLLAGLTWLS